jgi:N-methylhydantoinase B
MNAVELNLFVSRMTAICDEMGTVLRRTAFSPNIKDRLDFSCAVFDAGGSLCAQAAHIPVHLGSMAYAMAAIVNAVPWQRGDMLVLNDPYLGGTHLPDVTLIAPVFTETAERLAGFVANRAHHADIGCDSPGSMPIATRLQDEGRIIPPSFLFCGGKLQPDTVKLMSGPQASTLNADFAAQASANRLGVLRLGLLLEKMGLEKFNQGLIAMNDYADRLAHQALQKLTPGAYSFSDYLDDDGIASSDIPLCVNMAVHGEGVVLDFSASADQVSGNLNCPLSVAAAAAFYGFRCLMPEETPACAGAFRRIKLIARPRSIMNAERPAAVAAGNVETSSRMVDVILGALAQAIPEMIPAASQGSMNNIAMGKSESANTPRWDYYETLGGGMGGGPKYPGLSAVHSHMTNTLNTPVESLEMHYPLRVRRYEIRRGSGGKGRHPGGNGVIREYEFLGDARFTLLTERRLHAPWGLAGGSPAQPGLNHLNGQALAGKCSMSVGAGDRLLIQTPGGGGYGADSNAATE